MSTTTRINTSALMFAVARQVFTEKLRQLAYAGDGKLDEVAVRATALRCAELYFRDCNGSELANIAERLVCETR